MIGTRHARTLRQPFCCYLLVPQPLEMEEHVPQKTGDFIWTEEKCLELIRRFRARPVLWNTKSPMFYKQNVKKQVWNILGKEVNTSGAECKHKMNILLSSFRREKAKLKNNLSRYGAPFQSTWFAFNDLSFLLNKDSEEDSSENDYYTLSDVDPLNESYLKSEGTDYVPEENSNDFNLKLEPLSDEDQELGRDLGVITMVESAKDYNIEIESVRNPTTEGIQQNAINAQNLELPVKTVVKHKDSHMNEEIETFTAYVAAKMKKYSSQTLLTIQKEICDILFKADQSLCDSNTGSDDGQSDSKKRKLTDEDNN